MYEVIRVICWHIFRKSSRMWRDSMATVLMLYTDKVSDITIDNVVSRKFGTALIWGVVYK